MPKITKPCAKVCSLIIESQDDMEVVGEAGDGREAIRLAEELNPDIVLMDVSMPELNGLLATAKLKRIMPDMKILTLTRHTDEAYLQELLQAGSFRLCFKAERVSRTASRCSRRRLGRQISRSGNRGQSFRQLHGNSGKLRGEMRGASLSGRESEILRLIALGYSNKEIAEQFDISVKTVETHKAHAQQKLHLKSRKDIIGYAILQGWMQEN